MAEEIYVNLEFTPNPNTLKFLVNRSFLASGTANFLTKQEAEVDSPLALAVFEVPGISAVMVGTNFVTITKTEAGDWDVVAEQVPAVIQKHLEENKPLFSAEWTAKIETQKNRPLNELEQKIKEVLDREIRPAVAMDGGDITFDRFEDGVVYLSMQGACSSCPSSTMTLKMGVESRLKNAIPEVREVVQV